jgi:hypothetical protein
MTALAGGSGSSAAGVVALVVGCLAFALSLPGEFVSIALRFYRRKPVTISRPKAGRPHE